MAYDPLKDPMAQSILSATPPQAMIGPPSPPPPAAPFQLRPPQAPRLPGGGFDPAAVPPPMKPLDTIARPDITYKPEYFLETVTETIATTVGG